MRWHNERLALFTRIKHNNIFLNIIVTSFTQLNQKHRKQ